MSIYLHLQILGSRFLDILFPKKPIVVELERKASNHALLDLPSAEETSLSHCSALFSYKDAHVRELIWQIKYQKNRMLTQEVSRLLYESILDDIQDSFYFKKQEQILLVSVPSTRKRKRERGGNQSERITITILSYDTENMFEYYPDTIKKIRDTVSQTKTKNRAERLKNLTGAFVVQDSEKVKGRRVILIDDVVTTGSTLKEMRDLLKDAGAKSVESFVIAH